mgnify:CR=1 FL=1
MCVCLPNTCNPWSLLNQNMVYQERSYRDQSPHQGQLKFTVIVEESDLFVVMDKVTSEAEALAFSTQIITDFRRDLKQIISDFPQFLTSHQPIEIKFDHLQLHYSNEIQRMIDASKIAQVGPMACVAGITSEVLVKAIQQKFNVKNVIAENGGDIYMDADHDIKTSIFAGTSVLSNQLACVIQKEECPTSVCTSSGTVGHSFSYGKADAVVVVCKDSALVDAMATSLCNHVQSENDIEEVINQGIQVQNIETVIIIKDDRIGFSENAQLTKV